MAENVEVTVTDVTKNNFITLWPAISFAVKTASFIAIDLELSGLGDRKQLNASSVDDRYKTLCNIARSRSVIALGLACFCQQQKEVPQDKTFQVRTFNLVLLCEDEYMVEAQSLRFLVNYGFDFNKQYASGIPYKKGNIEATKDNVSVRQLLMDIISARKPLLFHNGFIDLVFLYQSLYAELPNSLQTFVADTSEMFPNGLFDTKYISEFHSRENLSFLEYLFRKCQYRNQKAKNDGKSFITISSKASQIKQNMTDVEIVQCSLPSVEISESLKKCLPLLCTSFRERGYCPSETTCSKLHSVDLILVSENSAHEKKKRRRSRKRKIESEDETNPPDNDNDNDNSFEPCEKIAKCQTNDSQDTVNKTLTESTLDNSNETEEENSSLEHSFEKITLPRMNGHRAGFDAFMTGYCFAFYEQNNVELCSEGVKEWRNKVYLTAKDVPLIIMKSHFAKTSAQHQRIVSMMQQQ